MRWQRPRHRAADTKRATHDEQDVTERCHAAKLPKPVRAADEVLPPVTQRSASQLAASVKEQAQAPVRVRRQCRCEERLVWARQQLLAAQRYPTLAQVIARSPKGEAN